jgi:lipoprotein NlpI
MPGLLISLMLRAAVLAALLLPALGAQAQGEREVQLAAGAFTRGEPLPAWALPFAEMPATTRPDPVVIRVAETQIHLDDTVRYLVNRALQVNDAGALSQIGQYALYFVPQYQRIRLHRVGLVRNGRELDRSAQVSVRFLERESGLESGIYSGMVTAVLLLEDVRVGDTLHLVYTLEGQNPVFGRLYSHTLPWDHAEPVELRRATLIAPASRRIAWRMQGDHRPAQITPVDLSPAGGALRVLRFEERGIDGLDDEPGTPDDFIAARALQLTEFADWHAVADWATTLFPADAALPPELQPQLERWRALPTPQQRAVAALQWVQEEIRYFSVSMGESSHRPSPPAAVVQRRYGDCKDKSLLLATLLRALGIDASPVLVSLTSPKAPARFLPNPDVFDHVVVQARIGGRLHYLDGTRLGQRGTLERLGPTLEGASGLVVDAGTQDLVKLQAADAQALATNELREHFSLAALDADGRLEMRRTWNGTDAELMRLAYQRMTPEQRRKQVLGPYERRYPGISLVGEPRVIDDTERNSLALEAEFSVPRPAKESGGDWALRFFPDNLVGAVHLPEKFNRSFPAEVMRLPSQVRYHLAVRWPEAVSMVQPPSTARIDSRFFRAEVQRSFRGNLATLDLQYAPRVAVVAPRELSPLMEDLKKLERSLGGSVSVEQAAIKRGGFLGLGRTTLQDQISARLEREIARAGQAIDGGQLDGEDLADALCTRAEALAERGRAAEGLKDAQEAVRLAPASGRAFQCRADLLLASGEFAQAVPDYTRALSLGQEAYGVLYRRGHARFYAGQPAAAAADFAKAAALKAPGNEGPDGTYALLWQLWSLQSAGLPVPAQLQALAQGSAEGRWPRPALAMLAGALSPEQVLAGVSRTQQGDALALTLSEAWFYVGEYYQGKGLAAQAREAFEKSRAQGVTPHLEHWAAGIELARTVR